MVVVRAQNRSYPIWRIIPPSFLSTVFFPNKLAVPHSASATSKHLCWYGDTISNDESRWRNHNAAGQRGKTRIDRRKAINYFPIYILFIPLIWESFDPFR